MSNRPSKTATLYATRDHYALSPQFERHMLALTAEGLESKSAIAAELAFRDIEIERLMHHVRASPSLSNQYVQLAETEIAAQRRACEELRAAAGNKQKQSETFDNPERPFAWYRAETKEFARGDWPPPVPDDTVWEPLYLTPAGRPVQIETYEHEWVIVYADQARMVEHFSGAGADAAARGRFEQLKMAWTCRLFQCVDKTGYGPSVKATALPGISILDRTVTVCAACLCASCWQGAFYCDQAKTAGTIEKTIRELWQGNVREDSGYWFKDPNTGEIDYAAKSAARSAMNGDEQL